VRLRIWIKAVFLAFCFTFIFNLSALADQCAYISKEQALAAVSRLSLNQTIYEYCQPCGDCRPKFFPIEVLSTGTTSYEDFWEVRVNGSNVDLAYTFIDAGIKDQKINLAAVVGCPAADVSITLP
jgi:hypothetical protein